MDSVGSPPPRLCSGCDRQDTARLESKPVDGVRPQGEYVRLISDGPEGRLAGDFDGNASLVIMQVEFGVLYEPRKIGNHKNLLVLVAADEGQRFCGCWVGEIRDRHARRLDSACGGRSVAS